MYQSKKNYVDKQDIEFILWSHFVTSNKSWS